jgi:RNA polymerase-interacting CarD/CdnL/TRCF family regulator
MLDHLDVVADAVDSPKFLLIIRNAVHTLLETPGQDFSWKSVHELLSDEKFRSNVVSKLKEVTPDLWREEWDKMWKVEEDPLFSKAQQRIVKRQSLIVFWTEEWDTLPTKEKMHVAEVVSML